MPALETVKIQLKWFSGAAAFFNEGRTFFPLEIFGRIISGAYRTVIVGR